MGLRLQCTSCGSSTPASSLDLRCTGCGEPLEFHGYERAALQTGHEGERSLLRRYGSSLPVRDTFSHIYLGEGQTPLLEAPQAAGGLCGASLLFKNETVNPTWSFKDRGTVVAVADAMERGFGHVGVVSTGNMAASVAAYGARAGLRVLVIVSGRIPDFKLAPVAVYGATVVRVQADYAALYDMSLRLAPEAVRFVNSDSPSRIEGSKTIAYEVCEQMGYSAPRWVIVPTSSGGNLRGIIKGFEELKGAGLIDRLPGFVCAQAAGCAPIADAWVQGLTRVVEVEHPRTTAHAIENPRPPSGNAVLRKFGRIGGLCVSVEDEHILSAQRLMASVGVFAQPAGAVPLAAAEVMAARGLLCADDKVVCIVTGSGLKHVPMPAALPGRILDCSPRQLEGCMTEWLGVS